MNWDIIIVAGIVATPPTIAAMTAAFIALRTAAKVEQVHKATNSMKDALVAAALIEGRENGIRQEKAAEAVRQKKARKAKVKK